MWFKLDELLVNGEVTDSAGTHVAQCSANLCPTVVAGHKDQALRFDGATQYMRVAAADDLDTLQAFTVAVWLRLGGLSGTGFMCPVNKPLGSSAANSWQLCANQSIITFISTSDSGVVDDMNFSDKLDTTWRHVALTWNGTRKELWVDGVLKTARSAHISFDVSRLTFGADWDQGFTAGFAGAIDDLQIYNRALTVAEIEVLAGI